VGQKEKTCTDVLLKLMYGKKLIYNYIDYLWGGRYIKKKL